MLSSRPPERAAAQLQPPGVELELNEGQAVHSLRRPGTVLTGDYWDEFLVTPLAVRGRPPRRIAILGNAGGTTARAICGIAPDYLP